MIDAEIERHRLSTRLASAVAAHPEPLQTPAMVVDLDAFDANAADLVRRAGGKPIRVASKSLRVPALVERALATPGFAGVLTYSLREALWLQRERGLSDLVMGYPSVDRGALAELVTSPSAAAAITLMVDDVAQLDVVDSVRSSKAVPVRIAIDVDAGLRLGSQHVGPKRSPLHDAGTVIALAEEIDRRPGFTLVGVMTYEGQVAGVPDDVPRQLAKSLIVRRLKAASIDQLAERRAAIDSALARLVKLEFWNAGGSGSIESSAADPVVTEVAAGSGLLVPGLFDHYLSFRPRPAAFFAVPVVRKPTPEMATVAGGGFIASGPAGKDRVPIPWLPLGLELTGLEGAGEVQTPLTGRAAARLAIGDLVWFRHAKSGELFEHTRQVHLLSGAEFVDTVPSYRGTDNAF
ncbi:amino acid deaminase/aldolase [Nocardioides dubius]|uniref:Amino acid deaminase/aldolase n=1 Tax=Nocardioides dubius TaxID=317019 RepID=A0ABN1TQ23_9ACTN